MDVSILFSVFYILAKFSVTEHHTGEITFWENFRKFLERLLKTFQVAQDLDISPSLRDTYSFVDNVEKMMENYTFVIDMLNVSLEMLFYRFVIRRNFFLELSEELSKDVLKMLRYEH